MIMKRVGRGEREKMPENRKAMIRSREKGT